VRYHVVGTFDSVQGQNLYVNEALVGTNSNTTRGSTLAARAHIAEQIDSVPFFFNGSIDDVRVYNRALGPDEIRQLYNAGR
jgi:arabinan endo-1,5-alpha-L-arabinosidase